MKELFKEVARLNMMESDIAKEEGAKKLFAGINAMNLPEYFNWASDIFEDFHVKETPDKKALIWMDMETRETKEYTYLSVSQKSNQLINLFLKSGVQNGDTLYMMSPVSPENWIASLSCIKAGIVSVPTATTMTRRELSFRFDMCAPVVIIADENSACIIDQALEETGIEPKLKLILGQKNGWVPFAASEAESIAAAGVKTRSDDILFCFFTSGTTGLPKRVGHTAISYPVGHLSTTLMMGVRPGDIHHNLSSPGWAKWAWSSFFVPFNVGATATGFRASLLDGEQYLDAVSNHGVTTFCAPPSAWRTFVNMNLDSFNLSGLTQCISAGEPLNPDLIEKWKRQTNEEIRDIYGQSESTAMIGNPPWLKGQIRPGSFGIPSPMYDMALTDREGNEIAKAGQVGHIVVKLDQWRPIGLFAEYVGSPEKMSSVFVDHYYYTGDRASFDEDGYWWFAGRADDVIKSSDYRIGPFEVESVLLEHPCVAEAAVIGSPDPKCYQLVKAYVILNPTYKASRSLALKLFKHAITILPKFKMPRIIEFVPEFPKTMSGKIRRVELRQIENTRQGETANEEITEYFYWDFPELGSKKRLT
jgi:4-hydroxybutyrate---CoA ligase (AMP-forming)